MCAFRRFQRSSAGSRSRGRRLASHQFAAASSAAFLEKTLIWRFGVTKSTDYISSDLCTGATSPTRSRTYSSWMTTAVTWTSTTKTSTSLTSRTLQL
uniref:Uncharacterized protein n=1 Tax=Hyaloperonospora arabidopsidis (strain Emoy2) TaxID=559515 RepID=M4B9C4_HYAAE